MMEAMIPSQVGMILGTLQKRKEAKKRKEKEKPQKMREKERRDNATILLPHLCFKIAP